MRHFEFLVEDSSGKLALEKLLPKIIDADATYKIHSYRGIGRLPAGLSPNTDATKRIFLDQLPRLLAGYGRAFVNDPDDYIRTVVIVCDLDDRNEKELSQEINQVILGCAPRPHTALCISIEEGEAWLLGDVDAVVAAYPRVNKADLLRYIPDSICGTWEFLADLVEKDGAKALKKLGFQAVGAAKHRWAAAIGPHVEKDRNRSPSFQELVRAITSKG